MTKYSIFDLYPLMYPYLHELVICCFSFILESSWFSFSIPMMYILHILVIVLECFLSFSNSLRKKKKKDWISVWEFATDLSSSSQILSWPCQVYWCIYQKYSLFLLHRFWFFLRISIFLLMLPICSFISTPFFH